ncbi:MAG TPA: hypothetical protein VIU11_18190 [Nakamurella sp.]
MIYRADGVGARGPPGSPGPHIVDVGCLNVKDLERVDLDILEQIDSRS